MLILVVLACNVYIANSMVSRIYIYILFVVSGLDNTMYVYICIYIYIMCVCSQIVFSCVVIL